MNGKDGIDPVIALHKEADYYRSQVDELAGENVRLDYIVAGLRHELKQKRLGFAILSELQQSVGAHKQISSIFEATVHSTLATLGMDRALVLTPEQDNMYRPIHWAGYPNDGADGSDAEGSPLMRAMQVVLPRSVATSALVVNRESRMPTGVSAEDNAIVDRARDLLSLPYFVCVPVVVDANPIALLLAGRLKEARPLFPPFDEGDVDTLQAVTGLISASVRNLRIAVLEEMDRLKTEFFANISHEFRTPLTLTIGPLERILGGKHGPLPEAVTTELSLIKRNQERLLCLINQILDISKLEGGRMEMRFAPTANLVDFLSSRVDAFRPAADNKGLELRVYLDERLDSSAVYLDLEQFDKVVVNLLSNALKFTTTGHVEVVAGLTVDGQQVVQFVLRVSDTGAGIRADQLPYVFDRFRQADDSEIRQAGGTGIGLAMVKEIVERHGGTVEVRSQYGQGTMFQVSIPLGCAHLPPSSLLTTEPQWYERIVEPSTPVVFPVALGSLCSEDQLKATNDRTMRFHDPARPSILYAEDNPELRNYVFDLLQDEYNVYLASDGESALVALRSLRPDLLLTDQMMPRMSGADLLKAVRQSAELRSTPVLFLTARSSIDARIEGLEAGADDFLAKPFQEAELKARIRNILRARAQEKQLAQLNARLEARVQEQMSELVRTGELKYFLPQALVDQVLDGSLGSGERFERRKVTVLFADMVGFTDLTDQIEPEEISAVMNDFLRELTAVSIAHGGSVERFNGDAVMVVFGAPKPSEARTQASGAIQTAISMKAVVNQLGVAWRRQGIPCHPRLRIGINTGYCTVGVFGSEIMRCYTSIGSPVNIAARLQAEAQPDTILCSFSTWALVPDEVCAERLGELSLRGVARPIDTYRLAE